MIGNTIHEIGIAIAIGLKLFGMVDISWTTIVLFILFAFMRYSDGMTIAKEFLNAGDIIGKMQKEINDLKKENENLRNDMYETLDNHE